MTHVAFRGEIILKKGSLTWLAISESLASCCSIVYIIQTKKLFRINGSIHILEYKI